MALKTANLAVWWNATHFLQKVELEHLNSSTHRNRKVVRLGDLVLVACALGMQSLASVPIRDRN